LPATSEHWQAICIVICAVVPISLEEKRDGKETQEVQEACEDHAAEALGVVAAF
jgi:hypothetical protein